MAFPIDGVWASERTKGAPNGTNTSQKQLFYLKTKYRLLRQSTDNSIPFSVTLFGNSVASGMDRLNLITSDADFQKFFRPDELCCAGHYSARKFSDNFSLALLPTYVRRNYVSYMDMNNLYGLGIGGRLKVTHPDGCCCRLLFEFQKSGEQRLFPSAK